MKSRLGWWFIGSWLMCWVCVVEAAPKSDLWDYWNVSNEQSAQEVQHGQWARFLSGYLHSDSAGNNLVNYASVSEKDRSSLNQYVAQLEAIDPLSLNRNQQMAYWINLYNAVTVRLILENYPVKSITKLGGWLSFGPWDKELVHVNGKSLTLNDIEHRILRPIWRDKRIHYAVNCASVGCPNLNSEPYLAGRLNEQLDDAARKFINAEKGVSLQGDSIQLSSIYDWYAEDFVDEAALFDHLFHYMEQKKAEKVKETLNKDASTIHYGYDWSLNEAPSTF